MQQADGLRLVLDQAQMVAAEPDRRDVVHERVVPDVEDVSRIPGDGYAPVDRGPRDRDVLQPALQDPERLVAAGLGVDRARVLVVPLEELVGEAAQREEPVVLGEPFDGRLMHRAPLALEQVVLGVVRLATDAVPTLVLTLVEVAVVEDGLHEPLDRAVMTLLGRADEVVVRELECLPGLHET